MDYVTLAADKSTEGSLKYWVNHTLLPVSEIIKDAQNELYSRLRVREMRQAQSLTIALNATSVALPTGFLDPCSLKDQYKRDVNLRSPDVLDGYRALDTNGNILVAPIQNYAIFGEALQFDTQSNVATTFSLIFYQKPALLTSGSPTNFLTDRYSQLFRACLLKHAYAFRKAFDDAQLYAAELETQLRNIEVMDDLSARGLNDPEDLI